jgi:hypothetical protein
MVIYNLAIKTGSVLLFETARNATQQLQNSTESVMRPYRFSSLTTLCTIKGT